MNPIPTLSKSENAATLLVDGVPFFAIAGEVRNSASSSLAHMRQVVGPGISALGLNALIVPIAWESVEPEEGVFDFELVDGLIGLARQWGVRLIPLWFGLWKNAESTYVPGWVKRDTGRFFRSKLPNRIISYRSECSISCCCDAAIEKDAAAFSRLMQHLLQTDGEARTVITVQVENEVGLLGAERDLCPAAQERFLQPVPAAVAEAFGVAGNWEEAFGQDASPQFMSWYYARAVEKVAAAGKAQYPLPMYVNAWTVQYPGERPGVYPAGGPVAEYLSMWRLAAPSIDWYSPDIYLPDFAGECEKYLGGQNPLFVPEAHNNAAAAAKMLYVCGHKEGIGFSPFAIEDTGRLLAKTTEGPVQDVFHNSGAADTAAIPGIRIASDIITALWPQLCKDKGNCLLAGFLHRHHPKQGIPFGRYELRISYEEGGGGFVFQQSEDEFWVAATGCKVEILPPWGDAARVEFIEITEYDCSEGRLAAGRVLNGDDMALRFGASPTLLRARVHILPV